MARFDPKRSYEFNKYSVGNVQYPGGSPNGGKRLDPLGYQQRDLAAKSRMNAILRRLKAKKAGNYMSSAYQGTKGPLS